MKLAHLDYSFMIPFDENRVSTLVIENIKAYRDFLTDFLLCISGESDKWVLSDNNQVIPWKKKVIFFSDLLTVDINQKPILTALQHELAEKICNEEILLAQINQLLQQLYAAIDADMPAELIYDAYVTPDILAKIGNFHFETIGNDLLENLLTQISIIRDLLQPKLIIINNLSTYTTKVERKQFLKTIILEDIPLLCIESKNFDYDLIESELENVYTIDEDICFI